jgi:hypothetical protein
VPGDTVYAHHRWVKIAVTRDGFYKVEFKHLRNLGLFQGDTTVALDSLRLFTWPGFPVMPEKSYCDSCGYREVAIQFHESNDDGILNRNDEYFYFYAKGSSGWADEYDPAYPDTAYINHPYELRNYYYLTIARAGEEVGGTPSRIAAVDAPPDGGTVPATFPARVHYERDVDYYPHTSPILSNRPDLFWEKWFWKTLEMGKTPFHVADPAPDAPGVDGSQPFRLRARVWGVGADDDCPYPVAIPADHLLSVSINGIALPELDWAPDFGPTGSTSTTARIVDTTMTGGIQTTNDIAFGVVTPADVCNPDALHRGRTDRIALAWVELYYRRLFRASADTLSFASEPGGGDWRFVVGGFSSATPPRVFDVTDPVSPVEIMSFDYTADASPAGPYVLSFRRIEGAPHRYRILPATGVLSTLGTDVVDAPVPSVPLLDLASEEQSADFVIIHYDGFKAAADTLAAWRRLHLPVDAPGPFEVITIPVSALYDQFSGGRTDPAAVRSFLRAAYYNWKKRPRFVTFLGDASYDFKNLRGLAPAGGPGALIPSYENGWDISLSRQFSTDDWMLNVDNAIATLVLPEYVGGRIPADDANAAMGYVRKLLAYERTAPMGVYRNGVMLVADDEVKGTKPDDLQWTHLAQTAYLDEVNLPPQFDRRYVYLHKYPQGPGGTCPGARADIFRYVNEGVQIFNFVGHGSQFKIADEGVFLYADVGSLKNDDKPTAFISASCDVGKFNDPELQGLGERLALSATGGAVGVLSATEEAVSGQNATLNRSIFNSMFSRDTLTGTGQYYVGLGEALLAGKTASSVNSQKYQLMGDAGVRLNLPRLWVRFTLWDSAGTTPVAALQRGQTLLYRGEVRTSPRSDAPIVAMDGIADILIEDAQPREQAPDCREAPGCRPRPFYYYYAGSILRGDVSIVGGRFEGRFVVPLEASAGPRSRVRAYIDGTVAGVTEDGAGSIFSTVTSGVAEAYDQEGPRIALSFAGGSTNVRKDAQLEVDLADPSGILTTAHTPQNGIVVTVDDNTTTRVDITPSFRYAANSYTVGNAVFALPDLPEGAHTIKVSAADNLAQGLAAGQHRSTASIAFTVVETPPLTISRAYLFPDPTHSGQGGGGMFVVDAPGDSINVLLRVYTAAGKLIRVLKSPGGLGQVQIPWDGLDAEGDRLANGVYLFKVHVYARESDGSSSATQRVASEGRFVIINR